MSKGFKLFLAGFALAFAVILSWAFLYIQACRTVSAALTDLNQGLIPSTLSGEALEFATSLAVLEDASYTRDSLRILSPARAKARVKLTLAGQTVPLELGLTWRGGNWLISHSPQAAFAPGLVNSGGRLVLAGQEIDLVPPSGADAALVLMVAGEPALALPLNQAGRDKLLTMGGKELEFLAQGSVETHPWFQSFVGFKPAPLTVGMEDVNLYLWQGRLILAAARQSFIPRRVRVNISTANYQGIRHQELTISSQSKWHLAQPTAGTALDLSPGKAIFRPHEGGIQAIINGSEHFFSGRVILSAADPLTLQVSRSAGHPNYRGHLELANFADSLIVVNELDLEEYLKGVVPGEMPVSFGRQALEVQAIVARTYALNNILASTWRGTSAHVVDSVLSQVYKNTAEHAEASKAVAATAGKVLFLGGRPAPVRFFSTSSGYTGAAHQVWADGDGQFPGTPAASLVARPQFPGGAGTVTFTEEEYRHFIETPPPNAYDANSPWFRWQVTFSAADLSQAITASLQERHRQDQSVILQVIDGQEIRVEQLSADPLGQLQDIILAERGEGGVIMALDLVGSGGTWRVKREYNIRYVLRPGSYAAVQRQDDSKVPGMGLLPSTYMYWQLDKSQGSLQTITFHGGGYGHGVGMSQYGVRELVRRGWSREEILLHYFPQTQVVTISTVFR